MAIPLIIFASILLLLSYLFEITSRKTRIPSVILLLALGFTAKLLLDASGIIRIPDLNPILPTLGTLGLILIVLEGAMDLRLSKDKKKLILTSFFSALLSFTVKFVLIGIALHHFFNHDLIKSLINAIPLCIISSAIAIPSSVGLPKQNREYIIYESSFSDIIGVVIFNFFIYSTPITVGSVSWFAFEIFLILIITIISSLFLVFLIRKINHHVKFAPIILLVFLIYALSKFYHLPALIFILAFGIILNNLEEFKRAKWLQQIKLKSIEAEVHKFKDIVFEAAFLIRALFFLVFGFQITIADLTSQENLMMVAALIVLIYLIRFFQLVLTREKLIPLIYFAPRGLITILLFFSIPEDQRLELLNQSILVKIILITTIVLSIGMIFYRSPRKHSGPAN